MCAGIFLIGHLITQYWHHCQPSNQPWPKTNNKIQFELFSTFGGEYLNSSYPASPFKLLCISVCLVIWAKRQTPNNQEWPQGLFAAWSSQPKAAEFHWRAQLFCQRAQPGRVYWWFYNCVFVVVRCIHVYRLGFSEYRRKEAMGGDIDILFTAHYSVVGSGGTEDSRLWSTPQWRRCKKPR